MISFFWHDFLIMYIIQTKPLIMKTVLPLTLIVTFCLFFTFDAFSQDIFASTNETNPKIEKEINRGSENTYSKEIPEYFRHHKKLKSYFTGCAIEITTSDLPLQRDYFLFERFGSVRVDRMERGGFSYLITGFTNEKAAKDFCDLIARPQAPESKVVRYVKGRRK